MADSSAKTLTVAGVLCGICSVLVAGSVVVFKPQQQVNQALDQKKNILQSAGLFENKETIDSTYSKFVTPAVVDLATGEIADVDAEKFDQDKADKDPQYVESIAKSKDPAAIGSRSRLQKVYLVKNEQGLDQIVLHVYGKGLWSTMKGFLAVDKDGMTVRGFNYYSHGETPGLGGEIENPKWLASFKGKKIYDESGSFEPRTRVLKGAVNPNDPNAQYQIDGISGATLTAIGVQGTFQFWFSESGYKNFLAKVREGAIQ